MMQLTAVAPFQLIRDKRVCQATAPLGTLQQAIALTTPANTITPTTAQERSGRDFRKITIRRLISVFLMPLLVSCAETTLKKAPEVATTPFTASKAVKAVEALESALLTEEVKKILIAALSCQQPSSVGATFLTLNTSNILKNSLHLLPLDRLIDRYPSVEQR